MQNMKSSNPDLPTTEIAKKLGEMWQKMSSNIIYLSPLYSLWVIIPAPICLWGVFCNFSVMFTAKKIHIIDVFVISSYPCHEQAKRSSLIFSRPRLTRNAMKRNPLSIVVKHQLMWIPAMSLTRVTPYCTRDMGGNHWLSGQACEIISALDLVYWARNESRDICKWQLLPSCEIVVPCVC